MRTKATARSRTDAHRSCRLRAHRTWRATTAAHRDRRFSSATVGWGGTGPTSVRVGPLGATPESRVARAVELLDVIVDLRDRGMREPLPLYCATSHRYVTAVRSGRVSPADDAAKYWTSEYRWLKEDSDAEHVLALGDVRRFDEVLAAAPASDEVGAGWASSETTRFGRLARRLWDPVLDAAEGRST